jgi:hypothetical protein
MQNCRIYYNDFKSLSNKNVNSLLPLPGAPPPPPRSSIFDFRRVRSCLAVAASSCKRSNRTHTNQVQQKISGRNSKAEEQRFFIKRSSDSFCAAHTTRKIRRRTAAVQCRYIWGSISTYLRRGFCQGRWGTCCEKEPKKTMEREQLIRRANPERTRGP